MNPPQPHLGEHSALAAFFLFTIAGFLDKYSNALHGAAAILSCVAAGLSIWFTIKDRNSARKDRQAAKGNATAAPVRTKD